MGDQILAGFLVAAIDDDGAVAPVAAPLAGSNLQKLEIVRETSHLTCSAQDDAPIGRSGAVFNKWQLPKIWYFFWGRTNMRYGPQGAGTSLTDTSGASTMSNFWERERQEMLRRALDPLADIRWAVDPLGYAEAKLGVQSDTFRFLQEQERQHKLFQEIALHQKEFEAMAEVRKAIEEGERYRKIIAEPYEQAPQLGLLAPYSDIRKAIAMADEAHQAYQRMYRLPAVDEIAGLTGTAIATDRLAASVFRDVTLQSELRAAMEAMRSPWLNVKHQDRSAQVFAEIQAIGLSVDRRPPFDLGLASSLRPDLGDWRDLIEPTAFRLFVDPVERANFYLERGFNPGLTALPVRAFEESVVRAKLREAESAGPDETGEDDDGFARNRAAFDKLQRFEVAIRRFIAKTMEAAHGADWASLHLPGDMCARWEAKRATAIKAGEPERPLIDYADFTDYRAIIEHRGNWRLVFSSVFNRAEDMRESFQRLFPVRIATMHARIISTDDEMTLLVETKRILRAIDLHL